MDFVRAMASGSKGGQRGQFIDPTALSPGPEAGTGALGTIRLSSRHHPEPTEPVRKTLQTAQQDTH